MDNQTPIKISPFDLEEYLRLVIEVDIRTSGVRHNPNASPHPSVLYLCNNARHANDRPILLVDGAKLSSSLGALVDMNSESELEAEYTAGYNNGCADTTGEFDELVEVLRETNSELEDEIALLKEKLENVVE